ncbi:hypothetical protein AB0C89_04315 [Streptomyces sp. NPDC048491]|uniref:hypothetical protein n=1 Tax=Streptomyces sp. NPDC048491 TaxID=3157207 RepID=UPI00342DAA2A
MHTVSTRRAVLPVVALAASYVLLAPGTAVAGWGPGHSDGEVQPGQGTGSGATIASKVTFTPPPPPATANGTSHATPVGNWTPPACWYEPRTAAEFAKETEAGYSSVANDARQPSYAKSAVGQYREIYKDGKYKNYNLDKSDEGTFYVAVRDPDRWLTPEAQACDEMPFWVKNGETPPVKSAVTPEVLAQLAYKKLPLPTEKALLRPDANSKVNLPTWVWLSKLYHAYSVTARLKVGGVDISATTTATPVAVQLDPGTRDATLFPASGECAPNADGSIGEAYEVGDAGRTPPCGVTYLRATGGDSYKFTATVTWQIVWTGTGNPGTHPLPDATYGTPQDITVQEIQAVNR